MVIHLALASASAQSVSVAGSTCPGPMDVTVTGLTPNGSFALLTGTSGGRTTLPAGLPCAGTVLDVGQAASRLVTQADAGGTHLWAVPNVPGGLCGQSVQVVDAATCATSASVPVFVPDTVVDVAAGWEHTCALLDDGRVKCWGGNAFGQLGLGDVADRGDGASEMGANLPAVALGAGRTATAVTAGGSHTCALLDDGSVKCWGYNGQGQLGLGNLATRGDGPNEMGNNLSAVPLGTGRTAVEVTAGGAHTCALLDNGSVKCWGHNYDGELGLGNTATRGDGPNEMGNNLPAVALGTGRTARALAASVGHTCAVLDDGSVKCWGSNYIGELGLGDTANRGDGPGEMGNNLPVVDLGAGRTTLALTTGNTHTCAMLDDGSVKCWGENAMGQLGLGDTADRGGGPGEMGNNLPVVDLGAGLGAMALTAGDFHTCAVLDDSSLRCWGYNGYGQLGLGDPATRGDGPGEMGNNLPAVDLGAGRGAMVPKAGLYHTCAVLDDSSLKCWGWNRYGELGLGDTAVRGDRSGGMGNDLPAVDVY